MAFPEKLRAFLARPAVLEGARAAATALAVAVISFSAAGAAAAEPSALDAMRAQTLRQAVQQIDMAGMSEKIAIVDSSAMSRVDLSTLAGKTAAVAPDIADAIASKAKDEGEIFVMRNSASATASDYACVVVLPAPRSGHGELALMANLGIDDVPAPSDTGILDRFLANHELAHCLLGDSAGHEPAAEALAAGKTAEFASLVHGEETIADSYAMLKEIQSGASKRDLELIRDARFAAFGNPYISAVTGKKSADGLGGATHDTGDSLFELVDAYDDLRADPAFMAASPEKLLDMARANAALFKIKPPEMAKSIEASRGMRSAKMAGETLEEIHEGIRPWHKADPMAVQRSVDAERALLKSVDGADATIADWISANTKQNPAVDGPRIP